MERTGKQIRTLWQVLLFEGQKEEVRKHKREKVK